VLLPVEGFENDTVKPKTKDPFVALVSAAFSFLRVAEALNAGRKTYL